MPETVPTVSTKVASDLRHRTGASPQRAKLLARAYVLAVTSARELTPTATRTSPVGLLMRVMHHFGDVPTEADIAALLQVTPDTARRLLDDALAVPDTTAVMPPAPAPSRADRDDRGGPDSAPGPF